MAAVALGSSFSGLAGQKESRRKREKDGENGGLDGKKGDMRVGRC